MRITTILGSNIGDRRATMDGAVSMMEAAGERVVAASSWYETAPWGFACESPFLNRVVVWATERAPEDFLRLCLDTECRLGRVRGAGLRYQSRPIDIDILFCDSLVIRTPELTVPHPRMAERRFVLVPICEVMPDFEHPVTGEKMSAILEACQDKLEVRKIFSL